MEAPVFEEIEPAGDCDCPGCTHRRRALPYSPVLRTSAAAAARSVLVAAATVSVVSAALGAGLAAPAAAAPHATPHPGASDTSGIPGAPSASGVPGASSASSASSASGTPGVSGTPGASADDDGAGEETPQGPRAPLYGPVGGPVQSVPTRLPAITRAEIISRAQAWVTARVPYSTTAFWTDGYRQDCSGFVSMAWKLPQNEWTGSLGQYGVKITKAELQPGDMLLFHNPDDPERGSHVVLFGGWADSGHTSYIAYEQTPPHARRQTTPYAYWSNSDRYVPYRYKGVTAGTAGAQSAVRPAAGPATPFPGASYFGPGASNEYVTLLGRHLVKKGFGRYSGSGPGPRWSEADRRATEAFQRAQGWRGAAADGFPGPETWRRLFL
ncbi:peptidoglycan-binding protein [Streptomyces echinoruber]|uniref:Membrane protein n=1 Tax=Streptomyces echinoruber TaxID=68898 RepID=A0A918QZY9_9ACTN|nr:peptidoglycan-binding protein [Streptomyces echinoruber]GGZ79556.1 membrane protein [Streptomyces echinoruber]